MHRMTRRWRTSLIALPVVLGTVLFSASDCEDTSAPDAQKKEDTSRQSNYEKIVESQPMHSGSYSPTRDTKNFWIDTWMQSKGKLSYVYLLSNGKPWAFAVIKRLPVTYCTSLVPPYQLKQTDGGTEAWNTSVVPGPSVDGTYSSSSNCATQYGEDATTGAYVEWTVGADSTVLLRDQPLPLNMYADALPLGDTSAQKAQSLR